MSGQGVDWNARLKSAEDALLRAETTCAEREKKYDTAQEELKEYVSTNPGDTVSAVYKMLSVAPDRAYAAYEDAQKQVNKARDGVSETQTLARQAQAPQSPPDWGSTDGSGSKRRRVNNDAYVSDLVAECKRFDQTAPPKERLLARACYSTTLEQIAGNPDQRMFPVGGTPGVGKTTFRLWVLAQWLRTKKSQHNAGVDAWLDQFNAVSYYDALERIAYIWNEEGKVRGEVGKEILSNTRTLFLMEWTVEVSSRLDGVKALWPDSMAIVTGSPGRFAKGSQATKEDWCASTLYLPTWSTEELADVFEFSADLFHEYGGVARLWVMRAKRPDDASEYIEKAFAAANPEKFIQMQSGDIKETSQVHRLLDIGEKKGNIEGFISKAVADKAMALAVEAARGNIEEYVARVVATGGVFAKTYIGHLFEAYFSSAFGKRETGLKYDETNLQLRAGGECVPFTESVQCDDDVLYKPEKRNFHGIDCFVLRGETVIVLQVTVGKTHTPVSEEHPDIKKLTNKFSNKRFLLVYVVPSAALAETFRVQQGNPSAWTVRVGYPENERMFAVYGDKVSKLPKGVSLSTETSLKCQHCDTVITRQGTPFASPSGLKTHERSCRQKTT